MNKPIVFTKRLFNMLEVDAKIYGDKKVQKLVSDARRGDKKALTELEEWVKVNE